MNQDQLKQAVAQAAIDYILPHLEPRSIIGVGTGSTGGKRSPNPRGLRGIRQRVARRAWRMDGHIAAVERLVDVLAQEGDHG